VEGLDAGVWSEEVVGGLSGKETWKQSGSRLLCCHVPLLLKQHPEVYEARICVLDDKT
jgi:hypothetical protein